MKRILSMGTVINIHSVEAIVSGYDFIKKDEKMELAYLIVPYPQGYINSNSIKVFSDDDFTIIHEGYKSEISEIVISYIDNLRKIAENVSADEMQDYLQNQKYLGETEKK